MRKIKIIFMHFNCKNGLEKNWKWEKKLKVLVKKRKILEKNKIEWIVWKGNRNDRKIYNNY